MSTGVLFPQRPASSGVQTPNLPESNFDSGVAAAAAATTQSVADELEVIVLRPSIRPPTYDEVAQAAASPSRFSSGGGGGTTTASPGSYTNNSMMRGLPTTSGETPYQNISSMTLPIRNTNQQSYSSNNNNNNTGLNTSDVTVNKSTTTRSAVSPRKLACWTVGMGGGEEAIPTLKYRTIGDTVRGCLQTNDHRPLTNAELRTDWKRICALRAGQEIYKFRPPYIDRDEFADPLKLTSGAGTVSIPCSYVTKPSDNTLNTVYKTWQHEPRGSRPTARQNTEVCLKPTQIDPLEEKIPLVGSFGGSQNQNQATMSSPTNYSQTNYGAQLQLKNNSNNNNNNSWGTATGGKVTGSKTLREAAAVPLNIPPSNPIIEEADRRLQQRGFGGLGTVSRASDEAVSHLLKVCGFPDAQRLVILWEIRKAKKKQDV